jgi:hypothetical protein
VELREGRIRQWAFPFFGLTDEYKITVHEHIYGLVTIGFTFSELYSMPVYLRNFYLRLAIKKQEEEKREMDKIRGRTEGTPVSKKEASRVPSFVASQVSAK